MTYRLITQAVRAWAVCTALLVSQAPAAGQQAAAAAHAPGSSPPAGALNADLTGQPGFVLPFHLVNGHILIDGAVNGQRGKFMFDTGTEFPFFLNNHYLRLAKDQRVAEGRAGSGQRMVLYRQARPIGSIEIAGQVRFAQVPGVLHTNWNFLAEGYGMPAFLGSIGHGFNRNYIFTIDYDQQIISFHALDQDERAPARALDPARVLMTIAFTPTGVDGKLPEIEVRVGDQTLTAHFDTGNPGSLELTESMKTTLQQQGVLTLSASDFDHGARAPRTIGMLSQASYAGQALPTLYPLTVTIGSRNRIGLGYHFLKHYVSVWDDKRRTITLLRRL
jgi:hypothetical protein